MASTIEIIKCTGAGKTEASVSSIALKSTDDSTQTASESPLLILASGSNYSYESWIRFKMTVLDGACSNFQIWSPGDTLQSGNFKITVNTTAVVDGSYAAPVDTQSAKGTRADFKDRDSASKIAIAGTLSAVGQSTDFAVFQGVVFDTAIPGSIQDTCFYSYDEA